MNKTNKQTAASLFTMIFAVVFLSLAPSGSTITVAAYSGQAKAGGAVTNKKTVPKTTGKSSAAKEKNPIISKAEGTDDGPAFEDEKATSSNAANSFGWQLDDVGWWYRISQKEYIKSGWAAINGKLYCFNDEGYMVIGWVQIGEDWYYLETDGHMVTGNYKIGKVLYHFDYTGKLDLDHYDYGDFPPVS